MKETEQDRCIDIVVTRDCSYFVTEKYINNQKKIDTKHA